MSKLGKLLRLPHVEAESSAHYATNRMPAPTSANVIKSRGFERYERRDELAALTAALRDAERTGERFVLVTGNAGCGKSHLLRTLKSEVRLGGGVVLDGTCGPGVPFGAFAPIIDAAIRFLADVDRVPSDPEGLACSGGCHALWHEHGDGGVPASDRDSQESRMRFFESIRSLLRDVAELKAPVILLRDLHRSDEATLELLEYLFEGVGPWGNEVAPSQIVRALFVASAPEDAVARFETLLAPPVASVLRLGRLDRDGVRAFLQSETVIDRVLAATGGDPEQIEMLLRGQPADPIEVFFEDLDALPEGTRELIEVLAILDSRAELARIEQVSLSHASVPARKALDACSFLRKTVISGSEFFEFSRPRYAEALRASIPRSRRRELHRRCASALSESGSAASEHALQAGDVELAIELAVEDARALAAQHAHAEAAALLDRVVRGLEAQEHDVPSRLREALSDLQRACGDYAEALHHAELVLAQTPESTSAALRVGKLLTLAGTLDRARQVLGDAFETCSAGPEFGAVATALAELEYQRTRYEETEHWAKIAFDHVVDARTEIEVRNALAKAILASRSPSDAALLFQENLERAEAADLAHEQAQALTNLGVAHLTMNQGAEARRCFQLAAECARAVNDSRDLAIALENLGVLAHLERNFNDALHYYHESVAIFKKLANRAMLTRVGVNLAVLYQDLGDLERTKTLCDFAQHMGGDSLSPVQLGDCLVLRARVARLEGGFDRAEEMLDEALIAFQSVGSAKSNRVLVELVQTAIARGDVSTARKIIAEVPGDAEAIVNARLALATVRVERAAGGSPLQAARRAAERCAESRNPQLQIDSLLALTKELHAAADDAGARNALQRAQELERRLTANVPDSHIPTWSARASRVLMAELEQKVSIAPNGSASARTGKRPGGFPNIAGRSPRTMELLNIIEKVAPTDATVLIQGESGTGKELVAEALHRKSMRKKRPLVKVNCAALVDTLLMSELFGHERGAFTGAATRKKGRFELADGGTLFLDEIGDISPKMQAALLRVLQERTFERVGGTQSIEVDVRIIAATHRDLEAMVKEGTFREDLYYRLRGVAVPIRPLRERPEDIGDIANQIVSRLTNENERALSLPPETLAVLEAHPWPGNVRELENVLRSASLFANGTELRPEDLGSLQAATQERREDRLSQPPEEAIYERVRDGEAGLLEMKKIIEKECISRALGDSDGNITQAARLLGMKRPRLSQLAKQYGLTGRPGGKDVE